MLREVDRAVRWHIWLLPAALMAAAISLLCWGAWVYGYDPTWLNGSRAWWRPVLETNQSWTMVATLVLLLVSLGAYWWPRRRERIPIGLIIVVVLVLVAAVLGTVSYIPCRGHMSTTGVTFWIFQLYVGQPPNMVYQSVGQPAAACGGTPPLALQLGQMVGLGATGIGAIAVASVLWRKPLDRLQSRFAYDVTIFTGLNDLSMPLLKRLTRDARSPRAIIVIEPDDKNPLLEEARLTGARVVIGPPNSPHILRPIIAAARGCALTHLYAVSDKVADNEAVIKETTHILRHVRTHPDRQPHLIALIDDPRHASHWRGSHSSNWEVWFEDALSPAESTARGLVSQVLGQQPRHLLVCGDGTLTVPILVELARRAWEQAELVEALATGLAAEPDLRPADPPSPLLIEDVTLLDLRSGDVKREYLKSAPDTVLGSLSEPVAEQVRWQEDLLRRLDALDPAQARETVVVITEDPPGSGLHEAGRVARLRQETPVFVLASSGGASNGAIFNLLQPFEASLLVNGEVPEDTWTRIARHWHECYRLRHPLPPGHEKAPARLPWQHLDPFLRQDNILEVRSILKAVAKRGRQWAQVQLVPAGSIIELSEKELTEIAEAEHERWVERRIRAGRLGEFVVPWADLPPHQRAEERRHLRSQLARLEAAGFVPVVPKGGPPDEPDEPDKKGNKKKSGRFERTGFVQASRLTESLTWTSHAGEQMRGNPGDWRVVDEAGNLRTISDPDFQSSHEPAGDGRWRRVGTYLAWQVSETVVVRTKEGSATARVDDWVVEAPSGERWPVPDDQFRRTYNVCQPENAG